MRQPRPLSLRGTAAWLLATLYMPSAIAVPLSREPTALNIAQLSLNLNATHKDNDRLVYGNRELVPDHGWAEVMRFAANCGPAAEGLSRGFPNDCGREYEDLGRPDLASCDAKHNPPNKVGYGCWFFFSTGPVIDKTFYLGAGVNLTNLAGSGVSVNVGRSLRVDTRADASAALGLPCADPPLCEKPGTVQDKLYCERAAALGFDSIQFARPHRTCLSDDCVGTNPQELVLCTGTCMTEEVTEACPRGVQVKQLDSNTVCDCSSDSHVLNCGRGSKLYGRPDEGLQRCPENFKSPWFHMLMTSPELYEFFTFLVDREDLPHLQYQQNLARHRLELFSDRKGIAKSKLA